MRHIKLSDLELECEFCGKIFRPYRLEQKYCSLKCYWANGAKENSTKFKKGHKPWNKGIKGLHLSLATEFKKGHPSTHSYTPVGTLTIRTNKSNCQRRWIKITEPDKWVEYAKYVWWKHFGKIPKGFLIHHIDKNSLNDNVENLAMVTRAQHINIHRSELLLAKKIKNHYRRVEHSIDKPVV